MCFSTTVSQTSRRSMYRTAFTICLAIQAVAVFGAGPQETAVPIDDEPFAASLLDVDSVHVRFDTGTGERIVAMDDMLGWGTRREMQRGPVVILRDGSLLTTFADWALDADALLIESDIWKPTRISRQLVGGILVRVPSSAVARDGILDQIVAATGRLDQCVLLDEDVVRGTIVTSGEDTIEMDVESRSVSIPRAALRAVIFRNLVDRPRGGAMKWSVGFLAGDLVFADVVNVNGAGGQIVCDAGLTLLPWKTDVLLGEVCFLRPMCDRVVYLSDLEPARYKHVPLLKLAWPYRVDRNVLGGRLRHASRAFSKGLGMHSTSSLTYALDGEYRRFQADIGLDDMTQGRGSVVCRVYIDPGSGWQLAFESPVIRGRQSLVPVSVDVRGTQRISLIVDRSDQGDEWDHVNWIDARMLKSEE